MEKYKVLKTWVVGAYKSRTIWLSAGVVGLGLLQTYLPQFKDVIPDAYYGILLSGIGIAIGVLRVLTTRSLTEK